MWIAKNSITGKTYGKEFSSIYDCQKFIDNDLLFLQYEWKQIAYLESTFDIEIDYRKYAKKQGNNNSFVGEMVCRMQYALDKILSSKDFNGAHGQNVIRCWYVEQCRFAEGMDF